MADLRGCHSGLEFAEGQSKCRLSELRRSFDADGRFKRAATRFGSKSREKIQIIFRLLMSSHSANSSVLLFLQTLALGKGAFGFVSPSSAPASGAILHAPRPTRQERSHTLSVLFAIAVLVGLLHFLGVVCFFCPDQTKQQPMAEPLKMEVSTISLKKPEPQALPESKPVEAGKPPQKVQPKPKLKVVEQDLASDFAELEQFLQQHPYNHSAVAVPERSLPHETDAPVYSEAVLDAVYQHNPKPEYPMIARIRGWQGKVALKVQISAEGTVESVAVQHSSGYDELDEAAQQAVKAWRFVPARRRNTAVACTVVVPIIFSLQGQESA